MGAAVNMDCTAIVIVVRKPGGEERFYMRRGDSLDAEGRRRIIVTAQLGNAQVFPSSSRIERMLVSLRGDGYEVRTVEIVAVL